MAFAAEVELVIMTTCPLEAENIYCLALYSSSSLTVQSLPLLTSEERLSRGASRVR